MSQGTITVAEIILKARTNLATAGSGGYKSGKTHKLCQSLRSTSRTPNNGFDVPGGLPFHRSSHVSANCEVQPTKIGHGAHVHEKKKLEENELENV